MRREGEVESPPCPVVVRLSPTDVIQASQWAKEQSLARGYSRRNDTWGRGMLPGRDVRHAGFVGPQELPTTVGKVGEIAFAYYVNGASKKNLVSPDFAVHSRGDQGIDFRFPGFTVDVKAASKDPLSQWEPGLFIRYEENKILAADRYVFALVVRGKEDVVHLLGWIAKKDVLSHEIERRPAKHGGFNLVIPPHKLQTIRSVWKVAKEQSLCL